jgi:hypothetical protein
VGIAKRLTGRQWLDAARHPTRRDGAVLWALLVLPWAIALILIRRHHHLDVGDVGVLIAVSLGLPTLWVAWAAYRGPRRSAVAGSGLSMAQVADQLAVAVDAQWNAEAVIRRLNDPYPLPVSWVAADASLCDSWDSLVKLATSGAGWPPPPAAPTWAADPDDLAGEDTELVKVLARVPTGRLVVLGEPGAGKTMLMVRLVLDLLVRRDAGGPVPILVPMASWNPVDQDLRDWLIAQLLVNYPALASPPPDGATASTQAAALLAARLILPILDGLDEIPERVRGAAVSRINDALRPGAQVVVTCRVEQYRAAVRPPDGPEMTLRAAAAIRLEPLDADVIRSYLQDDAAGPVARARWDFLDTLSSKSPVRQALETPLMAGLARAIYNPRPRELTGTLHDPAELCDPALADRPAVESLLFDAFIPAAYRDYPPGRWKAQDAERWLVFLARHLEHNIGTANFAWWQLQDAAPRKTAGTIAGLAAKVLSAAGFGKAKVPARALGVTLRDFVGGFMIGLIIGVVVVVGLGFPPWLGFEIGTIFGLAVGSVAGFVALPGDPSEAPSPETVLARDREATLTLKFWTGFMVVVVSELVGKLVGEAWAGLWAGIVFGLMFALALGTRRMAWPLYLLTRGWLACHHHLPWSLMSFLSDAHRRGVLRQAGAVYQFRHLELQRRLATQPPENRQ